MKKIAVCLSLLLVSLPASAGVVYEIEVKDHGQSPPKSESVKTSFEGHWMKIETAGSGGSGRGEMIYRGDRREMVMIDHDGKSYYVIDEKTIKELAAQMNEAMAMMEQALVNVPESQRAMMEEMMKKKMPQMQTVERVKTELRKTNETAERNGYPCVRYEVLQNGIAVRELWVTDWKNVEGGAEVADLFYEMSEFFQEMLDSLPKFAETGGADHAFEHMREMDGFPVVTRELRSDGSVDNESILRSASQQSLGPDAFEPPSGYKRQKMFKGK